MLPRNIWPVSRVLVESVTVARGSVNAASKDTADDELRFLNSQISMLNSGRVRQFVRVADPHDTPALNNVMAIGDAGQGFHVLIDDEDRLAASAQTLQ